jgi:hypothetical protein
MFAPTGPKLLACQCLASPASTISSTSGAQGKETTAVQALQTTVAALQVTLATLETSMASTTEAQGNETLALEKVSDLLTTIRIQIGEHGVSKGK